MVVSGQLATLQSFGTPYLVPMTPFHPKDWGDTWWRWPWQALRRRLTEGRAQRLAWTSAPDGPEDE